VPNIIYVLHTRTVNGLEEGAVEDTRLWASGRKRKLGKWLYEELRDL